MPTLNVVYFFPARITRLGAVTCEGATMSESKMHAPLLMEAALVRRLNTRLDLRRRRLVARLLDDGCVYLTLRDAPLGTWEWSDDRFVFRRVGRKEPSFSAHTLLGAAAYVATLVD